MDSTQEKDRLLLWLFNEKFGRVELFAQGGFEQCRLIAPTCRH